MQPRHDEHVSHRPHHPHRAPTRGRHHLTAAAVTVGLLAAGTTAGDTAASTANPPGSLHGCTLTTSANTTVFDVLALLATVRNNDGVYEVLYNAHCPDGRSHAIWIAG